MPTSPIRCWPTLTRAWRKCSRSGLFTETRLGAWSAIMRSPSWRIWSSKVWKVSTTNGRMRRWKRLPWTNITTVCPTICGMATSRLTKRRSRFPKHWNMPMTTIVSHRLPKLWARWTIISIFWTVLFLIRLWSTRKRSICVVVTARVIGVLRLLR